MISNGVIRFRKRRGPLPRALVLLYFLNRITDFVSDFFDGITDLVSRLLGVRAFVTAGKHE